MRTTTCARCTEPATLVVFAGETFRFMVCDQHVADEVRLQIEAKKFRRKNAKALVEVWKV